MRKPALYSHGEPSSWVDGTCTPASRGAPLPWARVAAQAQATGACVWLAERSGSLGHLGLPSDLLRGLGRAGGVPEQQGPAALSWEVSCSHIGDTQAPAQPARPDESGTWGPACGSLALCCMPPEDIKQGRECWSAAAPQRECGCPRGLPGVMELRGMHSPALNEGCLGQRASEFCPLEQVREQGMMRKQ